MTSASIFLSATDLRDLSGQARPILQAQWLRSKSIPFIMGGDGMLKVSKEALLSIMERELDERSSLVDAARHRQEPWDKVEEKEMAVLLGTTCRALQGRRVRGRIPADVWRSVDGRIMYSLKRYDDWLESLWSVYTPPTTMPARRIGRKSSPGPVYKLV